MLNFALMGCGRIAQRHADLLGRAQIKGARLSAVCDINSAKAASFGRIYGVPHFTDIDELLEKMNVDVVSILTESGNHAKHTIQVAEYGKHVLVEKPMALTLQDADAMIEACEAANVKLFVVKQNRYNLPVQKLREAVEMERFGRLVLGTVRVRWCRSQDYYDQDSWRGTWSMDGGVLTNQASHHVDLLSWMMGEVESVHAFTHTALANIEAEDTAVVNLKFRNGALGIIEATTATRPKDLEGSLSILGEKGAVEISGFSVNKLMHWNFTDEIMEDSEVIKNFSENPPNVYGFGHKSYYEEVVEAISNGAAQKVDGYEGRRSVKLINAIYASADSGEAILLRDAKQYPKLGRQSYT